MKDNGIDITITVDIDNKADFSDKVKNDTDGKISEGRGIEKVNETEKLSSKIGASILYDMLTKMPEVLLAVGTTIISPFISSLLKMFKGKKPADNAGTTDHDNDNDTTYQSPPSAENNITKPPKIAQVNNSSIENNSVTLSEKPNLDTKISTDYEITINYTTNASDVEDELLKINKDEIGAPIENWSSEFNTTAESEKTTVETKLHELAKKLLATLKSIVTKKATVDVLKNEIYDLKNKLHSSKNVVIKSA